MKTTTRRTVRYIIGKNGTERINGAVALIMALDRAIRHGNTGSVYDFRGLRML
jgi:hypothetical protein